MKWTDQTFTRRNFLKYSAMTVGSLVASPALAWTQLAQEWPDADRLGRVCVGKVDVRSRPSVNASSMGVLYEDAVVVWLREVVGEVPLGRQSARWVETPDGYIYLPSLQPVRIVPNVPVTELPTSNLGRGMWCEVTMPHTQIFLENDSPKSPWLKFSFEQGIIPRLYYSQILWIDDIQKNSNGDILYRINERYGPGDLFWADGSAFRPLTEEELSPISPEVENKKILIDATPTRQILSCYEDNREIYTCQISSGSVWDAYGDIVDSWGTPLGAHPIWRKAVSIHMAGGDTGTGYDLPGVAWTMLFIGEGGVAIHSTFWHNDFGTPRSHGCVNCKPEDAKFIFRWTTPIIPWDPGDITVSMPGGTIVDVKEA